MKRIFSFALAAMMTITMGVLPAFAESHEEHYIRFPGETADGLILPEAVVGDSYNYTIPIAKCSDFPVEFSIVDGALPDGLALNDDGTITGTLGEVTTTRYTFGIQATGACTEHPSYPDPDAAQTSTVTCILDIHALIFNEEVMTPHEGGGFDLPPATVGQPYEYELKYTACEHMGNITFSANKDLVDPTRCLPGGLSLDLNSGKIYGTPAPDTEGDYVVELQVEGRWGEGEGTPIPDTNTFYLTVQSESDEPETIAWRIPYIKQVVRGGSRNPGPQTFTLEIFDVGVSGDADQVTISGDTGSSIVTTGAGNYTGDLSVTAPADALDEGFKVREKDGNAARWTYSDAFYTV